MQRVGALFYSYLGGMRKRDFLPLFLFWSCALLVSSVFLLIVWDILLEGVSSFSWDYFFSSPKDAGRSGGIAPILISTAMILFVCMAVSLPLGIGTALLLSEFIKEGSAFGSFLRRSLDLLAAVPSIVFGLFGHAFFSKLLGMGFSILSGGLTLACMVLPILIRSTEIGLRSVPADYRLGSAALGMSRYSALKNFILPLAVPSILSGFVLGVGRAVAETAALLFTSGYVDRMPSSFFDSGRSISIHIYDLSMNVPGGDSRAYASALVLILFLVFIYRMASWSSSRYLRGKISDE